MLRSKKKHTLFLLKNWLFLTNLCASTCSSWDRNGSTSCAADNDIQQIQSPIPLGLLNIRPKCATFATKEYLAINFVQQCPHHQFHNLCSIAKNFQLFALIKYIFLCAPHICHCHHYCHTIKHVDVRKF